MLRNITITVSEEAAHWARRKAADENTSVSRLVGDMLERQMRLTDEYQKAHDRWRSRNWSSPGLAVDRPSREQIHERNDRG